jgi:predicted dehydrogenase
MAKLGIGILSFAHGHVGAYCSQIRNFDDARLVAAWDDNEGRGRASAEQFGMRYSPHLEDVLGDSDVQAVFVASETNKHGDLCVAAAEAGKDIVLQKPMALSLAECDRITEAVRKAGVRFFMAFQMRHDPANQRMKQLIEDRTLGRIGLLRRRHCIGVLFDQNFVNGPSNWHISREANRGMWMDDAVHAADFIRWLLGPPASVIAEIDNVLTDCAPDDQGVAVFRFPGGAMAELVNASTTLAGENTTEIYGDQGVIIQNYGDGPSCNIPRPHETPMLRHYRRDRPQEGFVDLGIPTPPNHGHRIAAVARPAVDALLGQGPELPGLEDGRGSVEMILASYHAAEEGRRITFPYTES